MHPLEISDHRPTGIPLPENGARKPAGVPRRILVIPQGCTCALLTIRGLASFLALFVVTQYSAKLGLRAGFLLEAVFVAAMAALLFVLLRNRPADKGLPLSPAAW